MTETSSSDPIEVARRIIGGEGRAYLDGKWVDAAGAATFDVRSPSSGAVLARIADGRRADVQAAVLAADGALDSWAGTPGWLRYETIQRAVTRMREIADDLAVVISAESGKPLVEAAGEVLGVIRFFDWYSHEAARLPGAAWPRIRSDRDAMVLPEPVGVVAAITPWNYPGFMIACKVGAALAAGCTVVLKPAEQTPLTALAIAAAFDHAGLPAGVLNVLPTSAPQEFSAVVCGNPMVGCITFTGSRVVGELILRAAAPAIQKVLLELGGNAPALVLEDADLDLAVEQLTKARFLNAGQACVAANRIYVHRAVSKAFSEKLVRAVSVLRLGDPFVSGSDLGPLIETAAVERLEAQLRAALEQGAQLLTGGARTVETGASAYFEPTVVAAMGAAQPAVFTEELFGPVAALVTVDDDEDAILLANRSDYGLAAYVFSRDRARGLAVAARLKAGSVGVNCALVSEPQLPFGGIRASGLGRERGRMGIEEFLEWKTIQVAIG